MSWNIYFTIIHLLKLVKIEISYCTLFPRGKVPPSWKLLLPGKTTMQTKLEVHFMTKKNYYLNWNKSTKIVWVTSYIMMCITFKLMKKTHYKLFLRSCLNKSMFKNNNTLVCNWHLEVLLIHLILKHSITLLYSLEVFTIRIFKNTATVLLCIAYCTCEHL